MYKVISTVDKKYIKSLCIYHFLLVLTHSNTEDEDEDEDQYNLVSNSVKIGRKLVRKYIYELLCK